VYNNFFGFKERPFQLVPNPDYLFLSRSHEEAMAHLKYAINHGDGFVEITGEVGTGKTTLCRAFLDDLDKDTEVAYIFNPRLNAIELLKTINDEFGIPSNANNTKDLIDTLNTFLMEKKSQKKNALLLVDEAQNLGQDVLEQLRLLSNLETNTSKLLQIILVGQPELRNMLDSFELRQLRQRITLSWYLTPMTRKETREYIRHRVNIASKKDEDKFTEMAYRKIYNYSGGIPRLINIVCDRTFLTAFGLNKDKVTGSIAVNAIKELKARGGEPHPALSYRKMAVAFLGLLCLLLIAALLFKFPGFFHSAEVDKKNISNTVNASSQTESTAKSEPEIKPPTTFEGFLGTLSGRSSRLTALSTTLSLWETIPTLNPSLNNMDSAPDFFQLAAAHNNFQLLQVDNNLDLVKKLNLPAVFEFLPPGALSPKYLVLIKMDGDKMTFRGGEKIETETVEQNEMTRYWSGTAYIPWKDFLNCKGDIPLDAPKESIFTLKLLLRDAGFGELKLDYEYDDAARGAVEAIQQTHGITVDGIVGARTKIIIYNIKRDLKVPHIINIENEGV
jgi:general secretion pathway protein A